MAQFLIKYQETSTHTAIVEADSLDEAKTLVSAGPQPIEGEEIGDSWTDTVIHVQSDGLTRPILGSDTVNFQ